MRIEDCLLPVGARVCHDASAECWRCGWNPIIAAARMRLIECYGEHALDGKLKNKQEGNDNG